MLLDIGPALSFAITASVFFISLPWIIRAIEGI